jgi:uncharacterized protein YgbK (DUF1537 family)
MLVVIADDLTGAAEIGGLGLKYDLDIEITTSIDPSSKADLLVISTDTRSMPEKEALEITTSLTKAIHQLKPNVLFKKIDSALRGHVVAEVRAHLEQLNLKKALIAPANPALGRTLTNGYYYINGQPIHLTGFAHDPEFPVSSSRAHDMLGVEEGDIHVKKHHHKLPSSGIIVGECLNHDDLQAWLTKTDNETLLCGGAGIFATLLESLNLKERRMSFMNQTKPNTLKLFVCGSTANSSRQLIGNVKDTGGPVSYMPVEIIALAKHGKALFENWADEIVSLLKIHGKAIIAIDESTTHNLEITAAELRGRMAMAVEGVFKTIAIGELLIEGGSTAAAIINRLNFNRFSPVAELGPGVIKMKVDHVADLFLTLKPGSYKWPADTWNF